MTEIGVGTEVPVVEQTATLETSVRYAGASGDMNPLHYDPSFAAKVSSTGGIIAHGMYSMGLASRALTGLFGDVERILDIEVRFSRPWPVGETAKFGGRVTRVEDGVATVELRGVTTSGDRVLRGRAQVAVGAAAPV